MMSLINFGANMTILQLILFIASIVIFYIFFKKLFSEDYPKRGIDFEANNADEQIGGINRPDKLFSTPEVTPDRMTQLLSIADESVQNDNMLEAKKALQSALILDKENPEIISRYAYVLNSMNSFAEAKEQYEKVLELEPNDDTAHASLANILHQLGKDEEAIVHHKKSLELDPDYAPHFYNYANTLYDLGQGDKALELYEQAYVLDITLEAAKVMIDKLKQKV